jgi:Ca2+-binding RTX toxin-like protein
MAMALVEGDDSDNDLWATEASFMYGFGGNDTINGSNFNDIIEAGTGNDVIYANAGNDMVIGNEGSDRLYGGDGDDFIVGDNTLDASGAGNDFLSGGAGNDRLHGNYGNDNYLYSVNSGIDIINDGLTAAGIAGYGGGTDTLGFSNATFNDIYYQHLASSNDLLLFTSAGVDENGSIQHGVIIQDFYLNDNNTNIEYMKDSTGAKFDLSQLLTPGETSYTESSSHSLAFA